jgi:hypothetical protein
LAPAKGVEELNAVPARHGSLIKGESMPKPVRWIERLPVTLKKDDIHASVLKKEGFESYVSNQLWTLGWEEASLYYHQGSYINWRVMEQIHLELEIG